VRILRLGILAFCFIFCMLPTQSTASELLQQYESVLASGDFQQVKKLAKTYYVVPSENKQLVDAFAAFVLDRKGDTDRNHTDALAWICRAIGASKNGRYYTTLLDIGRHARQKKIRKYARIALKQVGFATGEQYLDIYHKAK